VSIMPEQQLDEHVTPEHVRDVGPSALGCEDCLNTGGWWVDEQYFESLGPPANTYGRHFGSAG
jgi:hypothetical protein